VVSRRPPGQPRETCLDPAHPGAAEKPAHPGPAGRPATAAAEAARPGPADEAAPATPPAPPGELAVPEEDSETVVAVFSGATRRGAWEPPARVRALALFGGVELDFCEADLLEGTTRVDVLALFGGVFGGVTVRVPDDVHVDCGGLGLFGSFSNRSQRAEQADAPGLQIRGLALFGGAELKGPRRRKGRRKRREKG